MRWIRRAAESEAASARACSSAPARGGSMSAASNAASSSGSQRTAEEIARLGRDLAQARRVGGGARERGDRGGVRVGGENLTPTGEPQREGARAAEQVRDPFRARERRSANSREPRFSRLGRLQEAAGRQPRQRLAEGDARRPALDHDLAVIGDAREIERFGRPRRASALRRARAVPSRAGRHRARRASR